MFGGAELRLFPKHLLTKWPQLSHRLPYSGPACRSPYDATFTQEQMSSKSQNILELLNVFLLTGRRCVVALRVGRLSCRVKWSVFMLCRWSLSVVLKSLGTVITDLQQRFMALTDLTAAYLILHLIRGNALVLFLKVWKLNHLMLCFNYQVAKNNRVLSPLSVKL